MNINDFEVRKNNIINSVNLLIKFMQDIRKNKEHENVFFILEDIIYNYAKIKFISITYVKFYYKYLYNKFCQTYKCNFFFNLLQAFLII